MELIDLWKYQERIRRRQACAGIACLLVVGITFLSATEPEIPGRVCALFPETPNGRRAVLFLLDRELDRALAVYRAEDATQRHLVGSFEILGARDDGLAGETIQREQYLEARKTHILALQAERRRLAVKAGLPNRVDREIDYCGEHESHGQ